MIKKILLIIIVLGLTGCKKESEQKRSEKTEKKSLKNDTTVYNIKDVDILPQYAGDTNKLQAFIKKNYVKSEEIIREEIQAGIFAKVIIEKDGSLSNIEIIRDFGFGSGNELVRVLKLCPKWTPAIKDGQPVRCLYGMHYYVLIDD